MSSSPDTFTNEPRADFFRRLSSEEAGRHFPFGLGSDNHSGVHPRILKTFERVNDGFAPSYGTDPVTAEAITVFRTHFGQDVDVHFCFNGTAANVLAVAPFLRSHNSIICSQFAHIHVDECGAPEKFLGVKLVPVPAVPGDQAKITPESIAPFLIRKGDQHFSQPKVVSITQPTELGTVYSRAEIQRLVDYCAKHDLWLHVDGARFINAAIHLQCDLAGVARGADSVSFGGTKNGLVFGEAVLFLSDRAKRAASEFSFLRKQMMQLPSKTRFIAAQFIEFLGTDLWREIATHSCAEATRLRAGLEAIQLKFPDAIQFTQLTQSNAVFAIFERSLEKKIKNSAFFYVWDEATRECRLMTSWRTQQTDIEEVLKVAASEASRGHSK